MPFLGGNVEVDAVGEVFGGLSGGGVKRADGPHVTDHGGNLSPGVAARCQVLRGRLGALP